MRLLIIHREFGQWSAIHRGHVMFVTSEACWAISRTLVDSLAELWRGWRVCTVESSREDYGVRVP